MKETFIVSFSFVGIVMFKILCYNLIMNKIVQEGEKIDEEKNNIFRINLNVIVNGVWFKQR